ncbi:MAG: glycosyltransferase family 4 protein [Gammaproteobacteria bacterium]
MTVHLHDYGQVGVGSGGAPINYSEVSRLILATRDLAPARHDFHALVAEGSATALRQVIRPGDTLVCTAGPYAHLYHYWREQSGLDFRIIRDARTTAWTPYLAQEWLAAPLLRDGDELILPSDFARTFYRQLFPHLADAGVCVLYPLAAHLPAIRRGPGRDDGRLRIGCLGRIADDKNVAAAFELLREIQKARPAELHLAGAFYPRGTELASAADIPAFAGRLGLVPGSVIYHGDLPYQAIWRFLGEVDVLYFPAVSSNESFGRVLLEAGRAGVPVIATDYAAAAELVPAGNLVPVAYRAVRDAAITQPVSLGAPDTAAALAILDRGAEASDRSGSTRFSASAFLGLVRDGRAPPAEPFAVSAGVARFLDGLSLSGLTRLSRQEALGLCAEQLRFMRGLHHPRLSGRIGALARLLRHLPGNPTLSRVARERFLGSAPVGVLRNGVACARALDFDPRLSLSAAPAGPPVLGQP